MKTDKTKVLMRQIPNSYMLFCPDLMFLEDEPQLKKNAYVSSAQTVESGQWVGQSAG
jgi:hypothetical protein